MNWKLHPGPVRDCQWHRKSWDLQSRFGHSSYSVMLIAGTRFAWVKPNCWCFQPSVRCARHSFWNLWKNLSGEYYSVESR
mgnify:CR=1 FL=1